MDDEVGTVVGVVVGGMVVEVDDGVLVTVVEVTVDDEMAVVEVVVKICTVAVPDEDDT